MWINDIAEQIICRFVYDMFQAHNRAETKDVICRIPLLAPEANVL